MYQLVPKHKASEKLQAELKTKISDAKKEVEQEKKSPESRRQFTRFRDRAQSICISWESQFRKVQIALETDSATPEVASYPFTTREPIAA